MSESRGALAVALLCSCLLIVPASEGQEQKPLTVFDAVVGESGQKSPEISTAEVTRLLREGKTLVLDARPFREFAISHIPGALNVSAKPGVAMSLYVSDVAEIERLVRGRKDTTLVLYCNGPHCGKSKRLAQELLDAGFRDVRRYQLGIPVWRALGGITVIEPEGLREVAEKDRTLVLIDVRGSDAFGAGSLPGARSLPRSLVLEGEVKRAKDDGRLPMEDHNTRIVVVGRAADDARYVAEALAREAFHNVAYFHGSFEEARRALVR